MSVTTFTDVPAGNGLGSSSSFTVGVLHGLHAFRGEAPSAETLAAEACQVEIERLGKRIGVQDQYIAAYGGLRELTFERDGRVRAEEVLCSSGTRLALRRRLIVIFTGVQRPSGVLDDVIRDMESNEGVLQSMAERASALASDLRAGNVDEASRVIASGWEMKRRLANAISTPELDDIYIRAIAAGALGGKVLGAGGGGCLLLSVRPARRRDVLEALSDFTELVFDFEPRGSVRLA